MSTGTLVVTPQQIRANRLDLLTRLVDDLAHEVKNPLHALVINLELLRRRVLAGERAAALERVGVAVEEVERLHELVEAILQLLRPGDGTQVVDPGRTLSELLPVLELQAALANVMLVYEPRGPAPQVRLDPASLQQAVLNLTSNAIEAMRPGGGRLELGLSATDDGVLIRIRDSGPGLPPEWAQRVRDADPGPAGESGLGLAVTRVLLQEAGGRLELDEHGGQDGGAAFVLALPRWGGA